MKVFLVILFAFALSVSAFSEDARILDVGQTEEDDVTHEAFTTPSSSPSTKPTPTETVAPTATTPEETTPPPPPIVKPTIPDSIEDIVKDIVESETPVSQPGNIPEKETIIQPPITVSNETTANFLETIVQINNKTNTGEETTFPEVTTKPDSVQSKPPQAKMSTYNFPKKTTYLGIDVVKMVEKPPLQGTLGKSDEKTNIVVSSSEPVKEGISLNILSSVESSYIVNTEIDVFTQMSSSSSRRERLLASNTSNFEKDILTISECGIFENITNSTMENVKINIYGDVILNCTKDYNGIIANTIDNSHLINVRIEFMNKNSRIITVDGVKGSTYGLIAGRISNSTVYYVRVMGDILNIRDSTVTPTPSSESGGGDGGNGNPRRERLLETESTEVIISPLFGLVESTDIMNTYSDINNVLITSDSIVYGGIAAEYTPGIPQIERFYNDSEISTPFASSVVLNNTFSIIRKGLTVSNEKSTNTAAIIGGLIGRVTNSNKEESVTIESCYSSTTLDGLDHPQLRYAGFIGENGDKTELNFTYSYIVMNVKSQYLNDKGSVTAFINDNSNNGNNITNANYDRCYGYISSPFIVNRTDESYFTNLTYYYIRTNGFNKTDIIVRYLDTAPTPDKILVYGNGADTNDETFQETEKAVEELKKNGYNINPYNEITPTNNAPGTTPQGLYLSITATGGWSGTTFNPSGRGDPTTTIGIFILPEPISTRKMCPNNCNGNGKCVNGICYCNEGYNGVYCQDKTCPYGYMFNDPSIDKVNRPEGIAQVCSNQGYCNRVSGLCECFPGFEGNACQRKQCPNDCSNHGVCITVNKVESEDMVDYTMDYVRKYVDSDGEKVQVCVCDKEYEGYDCSLRKCPVGYSQMSDCDSQPQSTITLTFEGTSTGKNIYIKYTDPFGRVWYTIGFDYTNRIEWIKGLTSLPPGTISIDNVDELIPGKEYQITYSKYQTGRQVQLEVLTTTQIEELSSQYSFITTKDAENIVADGAGGVKVNYAVEDSLPATPCSGNGICDSTKGLCNCFSGFYGNSCSSHSSVV